MSASETQRTDGLIEALKAAIDADEQIALAAAPGPWRVNDEQLVETIYGPDNETVVGGSRWGGDAPVFDTNGDAIHIARQNPARTLAMVAAHREILELHKRSDEVPWYSVCDRCGTPLEYPVDWPCPTIKALAKGYGIEVQE